MKITGQAQFTKETNQEKFYNGSAGFQAGEFTVKVKNIEFNDRENRYFTIMKANNINIINLYRRINMISKKNN